MKRAFALVPVLLALGLTGCGDKSPGSFGVSVEKSQTNSTDKSKTVGGDKKIDTSEKSSMTIKIAAPLIVAEAAAQYCREAGISPPYRRNFFGSSDKTLGGKAPQKTPEQLRAATSAIQAIAAAFEPALGWPDGGEDAFMRKSRTLVNFANDITNEAMAKIGDNAIADPQAAKQAFLLSVAAIPASTLEAVWTSRVEETKKAGRASANLAGSNAPVEFKLGEQVITLGPQGMHLVAAGTTIFGDGKIGGKSVDFSLESSLSVGLGKKLTLDKKDSTTESENTKVDAGVKH